MTSTTRCSLLLLTTALVLSTAVPAKALTLTINPAESYLKIEVLLLGNPVASAQLPGSDVAAIGGTLNASFVGSFVNFVGGSTLDFLEFDNGNTNLLPDAGGGPSPGDPGPGAPADLGLVVDGLGALAGGPAAVRLAMGDITGGPELVTATHFDTTNLSLELTSGTLDANLTGSLLNAVVSEDISGNMAVNSLGSVGTSMIVSGQHYVIVPINISVEIPVEGFPFPIVAHFTGQIVTVPEPGTLALLGTACAAVTAVGHRRLGRRS